MLRHRFIGFMFISLLLLLPRLASAAQMQSYDLRDGKRTVEWKGIGDVVGTRVADGIRIQSTGTGILVADLTFSSPLPEAGMLTTSSENDVYMYVVWSVENGSGPIITYAAPVVVPAGQLVETPLFFEQYDRWEPKIVRFGFQFRPGTDIVVRSVTLGRWNALERALHTLLSFWTLDEYKPYSINFVWGPFLAPNPIQRQFLYGTERPNGESATEWAYKLIILLAVACVVYVVVKVKEREVRRARLIRLLLVGALSFWLLFDLRLGAQFLSWVWTDQRQYIGQAEARRTFRDRGTFYDFAAFAAPHVRDRATYVFFAPQEWPYLGNMRYLTYPAIPGNDAVHDDTWVVWDRPDITVSEAGQILYDSAPFTEPGKVLGRFDEHSFVFRIMH